MFEIFKGQWLNITCRYLSNRRRRKLNGTDYMKSKSGYAGKIRARKQAPCRN